MQIHYCDAWFRAKKRPSDLWTAEQAHDAYVNRSLYAAVMGPLEHPAAFIESNKDYIGVGFLDEQKREYLSYQFIEVSPGKLFLSLATYREFSGDTDELIRGTSYIFKVDGQVTIVDERFADGNVNTRHSTTDVSGNWDVYPLFGEYSSLLRKDRSNQRNWESLIRTDTRKSG